MPIVSRFFGIKILMYFLDHAPPHFHASYAEWEAVVRLDTLEISEGRLPRRALAMVLEWASLHRRALEENWECASRGRPLRRIPPLR